MKKGYISEARIKKLARACDGWIDCRKIFGEKKILFGLIKVGNAVEKVDYSVLLFFFTFLNKIASKDENIQAAAVLDTLLDYIEAKDLDGFNQYAADLLASRINLPLVENDKAVFLSVLNAFKEVFSLLIAEFEKAVAIGEAEANAD